jgi:putative flippase GtrA
MSVRKEAARFVVVGVVSNALLYLIYLGLTSVLGLGPKLAMSSTYALGILQTFVFNKQWTFAHRGGVSSSLARYLAAYGACYLINLSVMLLFVDRFGFNHAVVQGLAIGGIAVLLFLLQKYWVFAARAAERTGDAA